MLTARLSSLLLLSLFIGAGFQACEVNGETSEGGHAYDDARAIADELSAEGLGCADLTAPPGQVGFGGTDVGTCSVGDQTAAIYVYAGPDDRARDEPTAKQSPYLVVGPRWFVAVDDLSTAQSVKQALGGEIRGPNR